MDQPNQVSTHQSQTTSLDNLSIPAEFRRPRSPAEGPIRRVAFIFAMEEEAAPFIKTAGLSPAPKECSAIPCSLYEGKIGAVEVRVLVGGKDPLLNVSLVGTEFAALNTSLLIRDLRPDLLINAGTAGGFNARGGAVGDVYVSSGEIVSHDHRIPIPGYDHYGRGHYPVLELEFLPRLLGLKEGRVSSSNSLDATPHDLTRLEESSADVKDMEASAIAAVAWYEKVPFLAIKSVTDLVDAHESSQEQFIRNLHHASERLQEKLVALVGYLAHGRNFEEL